MLLLDLQKRRYIWRLHVLVWSGTVPRNMTLSNSDDGNSQNRVSDSVAQSIRQCDMVLGAKQLESRRMGIH